MRNRFTVFAFLITLFTLGSLLFSGCKEEVVKHPPKADFQADKTSTIARDSIHFTDISTNKPMGWYWEFPGGNPYMSTAQNPVVTYEKAGTYSVKMLTYNNDGSNDVIKEGYITITYKTSTFTDTRDGKVYKTIKLGDQVWMAENLNYYMPNTWYYNNDSATNSSYGRLYTWYSAVYAAPAGWHLPTDADWNALVAFLGGGDFTVAGGYMKEEGTTHWASPNTGDSNSIGFNALPAGYRAEGGTYSAMGTNAYFWTANSISDISSFYRGLQNDDSHLKKDYIYKLSGLSIRCVQD